MNQEPLDPADKDYYARQSLRSGQQLPDAVRGPGPVVVWRRRACRCWIVRVVLDPSGWVVMTRGFSVSAEEWIRRVDPEGVVRFGDDEELSVQAVSDGSVIGARQVEGREEVLPLDLDLWPRVTFEAGCQHGYGRFDLDQLADDARDFRSKRKKVGRQVDFDPLT